MMMSNSSLSQSCAKNVEQRIECLLGESGGNTETCVEVEESGWNGGIIKNGMESGEVRRLENEKAGDETLGNVVKIEAERLDIRNNNDEMRVQASSYDNENKLNAIPRLAEPEVWADSDLDVNDVLENGSVITLIENRAPCSNSSSPRLESCKECFEILDRSFQLHNFGTESELHMIPEDFSGSTTNLHRKAIVEDGFEARVSPREQEDSTLFPSERKILCTTRSLRNYNAAIESNLAMIPEGIESSTNSNWKPLDDIEDGLGAETNSSEHNSMLFHGSIPDADIESTATNLNPKILREIEEEEFESVSPSEHDSMLYPCQRKGFCTSRRSIYTSRDSLPTVKSCHASRRSLTLDLECRICHDNEGQDMISPCHCAGTSKWVHESCIIRWIKHAKSKQCEICTCPIKVKRKKKPIDQWTRPTATCGPCNKLDIWYCFVVALCLLIIISFVILQQRYDVSEQIETTIIFASIYVLCAMIIMMKIRYFWTWFTQRSSFWGNWKNLNEEWRIIEATDALPNTPVSPV